MVTPGHLNSTGRTGAEISGRDNGGALKNGDNTEKTLVQQEPRSSRRLGEEEGGSS